MKTLAWPALVTVVVSASCLAFACGGAPEVDLAGTTGSSTPAPSSTVPGIGTDAGVDSGRTGSTSSSSGGTDAGKKDPETPEGLDVFAGAPSYRATSGRNTFKFGKHPGFGDPAKEPCMKCHGPGGTGPRFFAGGSVFKDKAASAAVSQVEVRLVDAAGKSFSTYTDTLGNFVVTEQAAATAGLTFPLSVGVRDATTAKLMTDTITSGDCNSSSCHGGSQGFIHVP